MIRLGQDAWYMNNLTTSPVAQYSYEDAGPSTQKY